MLTKLRVICDDTKRAEFSPHGRPAWVDGQPLGSVCTYIEWGDLDALLHTIETARDKKK